MIRQDRYHVSWKIRSGLIFFFFLPSKEAPCLIFGGCLTWDCLAPYLAPLLDFFSSHLLLLAARCHMARSAGDTSDCRRPHGVSGRCRYTQ